MLLKCKYYYYLVNARILSKFCLLLPKMYQDYVLITDIPRRARILSTLSSGGSGLSSFLTVPLRYMHRLDDLVTIMYATHPYQDAVVSSNIFYSVNMISNIDSSGVIHLFRAT